MTLELGEPSERSAVIVRTTLPRGLERLRRTGAFDADHGVPAHLTMLYPWVEPARLGADVRRRLAAVAARSSPFTYRLVGAATWPDTIYVAVDPVAPFLDLQRRLADAFPAFPIYGADPGFEFVPHVTVADHDHVAEPGLTTDPAWQALPRAARATALDVIGTDAEGRWRLIWRIPLGRMRA